MKRLHRTVRSCCLSFLRFVMFLNLSSVKVYAANVKTFDFSVDVHTPVIPESESYGSGSVVLTSTTDLNPSLVFDLILPYDVLDSVISDYFVFNMVAHDSSQDLSAVSFTTNVEFYSNTNTLVGTYSGSWSNWESRSVSARFTTQNRISRHINRVRFVCSWNGGQASRYENLMLNIYAVITNADGTQSIIQAINNQTDELKDKIDEVLTPEGENNLGSYVDDITDQIDDNLGALGFAHDTVENFIGLFNEEPPAPVITVPPLKMKIKGVEHQFFNGYEYDIRTLESGPLNFLIQAVRFACSGVLWWAFLSYCFDVFDELFRGS